MRIGYACIALGIEATTNRRCLLKNASEAKLKELIGTNLQDLLEILKYNKAKGIRLFRISSDIIPFGSHPVNQLPWWEIFAVQLQEIGTYIRENDMRVSMHPGQYTVLNSPHVDIAARAIDDLVYHTRFLDVLGLDQSHKIVLHVGGIYGNKAMAMARFKQNYAQLPLEVKKRLVLENDDDFFHLEDVLDICISVKMPVVLDILHDQVNPSPASRSLNDKINAVYKTWSNADGMPKVHFSCQAPGKPPGVHSDTIYTESFLSLFQEVQDKAIDIMLEVKDKDFSAIKCNALGFGIAPSQMENQWACYKYSVLTHDRQAYGQLREILREKRPEYIRNFYLALENALKKPIQPDQAANAVQCVWECFKEQATDQERAKFFKLLEKYAAGQIQLKSIKNHLKRLAVKYDVKYLLDSYYFVVD